MPGVEQFRLAYCLEHPFSRSGISHAVTLAKIQILLDRHLFLTGPVISCRIVLKDFHLHASFEVNLSSALAVCRSWLSAPQFNNTRSFFCRHRETLKY